MDVAAADGAADLCIHGAQVAMLVVRHGRVLFLLGQRMFDAVHDRALLGEQQGEQEEQRQKIAERLHGGATLANGVQGRKAPFCHASGGAAIDLDHWKGELSGIRTVRLRKFGPKRLGFLARCQVFFNQAVALKSESMNPQMIFRYPKWLAYLRYAIAVAMLIALYAGVHPEWWGWLLFLPLFLALVYDGVRVHRYSLTVADGRITVDGLRRGQYLVSEITAVDVWLAKGGRVAVVTFGGRRKLSFPSSLAGFDRLVGLLRVRAGLPAPSQQA